MPERPRRCPSDRDGQRTRCQPHDRLSAAEPIEVERQPGDQRDQRGAIPVMTWSCAGHRFGDDVAEIRSDKQRRKQIAGQAGKLERRSRSPVTQAPTERETQGRAQCRPIRRQRSVPSPRTRSTAATVNTSAATRSRPAPHHRPRRRATSRGRPISATISQPIVPSTTMFKRTTHRTRRLERC